MNRRTKQRGVALVETALTISLFLLLVMGAIEFGFMMFTWARAYEGTRETVRTAIVSDPVADLSALDCDGGTTTVSINCDGEPDCLPLLDRMRLFLNNVQGSNLQVTYSCTSVGFDQRPEELLIPEVKVELVNYTHELVIPTLVGLPGSWSLPTMTSTRTGEDLNTIE